MGDERNQEQHQENEEQDLSDARSGDGHAPESKHGRDDGDHKENQGPIKHISSSHLGDEASPPVVS
jgi:hypothetical protein